MYVLLFRDSSPKNENAVTAFSPSCRTKPAFFFGGKGETTPESMGSNLWYKFYFKYLLSSLE